MIHADPLFEGDLPHKKSGVLHSDATPALLN